MSDTSKIPAPLIRVLRSLANLDAACKDARKDGFSVTVEHIYDPTKKHRNGFRVEIAGYDFHVANIEPGKKGEAQIARITA